MSDTDKEKSWFLHEDNLKFIKTELDGQQWVPVFWNKKTELEHLMYYCALVPNSKVDNSLERSA